MSRIQKVLSTTIFAVVSFLLIIQPCEFGGEVMGNAVQRESEVDGGEEARVEEKEDVGQGSSTKYTQPNKEEVKSGLASWYGGVFDGRKTASGEIFDKRKLTAAHRDLPFGTVLCVEGSDSSTRVRVTDRGPFVVGRILDLSEGAFAKLAPTSRGVLPVKYWVCE